MNKKATAEQAEVISPNIELLEQAVEQKDYERACSILLAILTELDDNFGLLGQIEFSYPEQYQAETLDMDLVVYFCHRMANVITKLFTDQELTISDIGMQRFFSFQRWMAMIFASSSYINADHILQVYNKNPVPGSLEVELESNRDSLVKFCIMYFPESNLNLNLDMLWNIAPDVCASLCFALQSGRFIGTPAAFSKRAAILQWFPEKLATLSDLNSVPNSICHDVYMHCSYDVAPNKHDVKKALNTVIRRNHFLCGWKDLDVSQIGYPDGKPVMVVILEHFNMAHSIYRTHSTSMIAAREHFYLIGIGSERIDEQGRAVFDEFVLSPHDDHIYSRMGLVRDICEKNQAAILYMPSIGMDLLSIFLSNTRVAPIQAIALGHPATTYSDFIEYVVVEDDYVGSEDCFSETLLRLPKDALPYVPSAFAPTNVEYVLRENPAVINIGIAATTMKLNPYFLEILRIIRDKAAVKIHFHFMLGQSYGITHPYVARFIKSYLGDDATAHQQTPYQEYLGLIKDCDMMLNPLPFGNTNGIIDMVTMGLVGICKTGAEVHEHIDEGLFRRLGLPDWLIANTIDEYIERAIRLAENHEERLALRHQIIKNNGLNTLFSGNPRPMGEVFLKKLKAWAKKNGVKIKPKRKTKKPA